MKKNLTDWFPGHVRPMRTGIYERDDRGTGMEDGEPNFSFWDGKRWLNSGSTIELAEICSCYGNSGEQQLPWRGLTEQAK